MVQAAVLAPTTIGNLAVLAAIFLLFSPIAPRPWGWRRQGVLLHRERLSLLGRLRMWGRQLAAIVIISVVVWRLGWVSGWAFDLALIAAIVALLSPVRYTLTSEGIQIGMAPIRRWTEFGGVARRRWGVRLQGAAGNDSQVVWLSGTRNDDHLVLLMRQLMRGSYKGEIDVGTGDETPERSPSFQISLRAIPGAE